MADTLRPPGEAPVDDRALAREPVATTDSADLELAALAAEAVPRRRHVPSPREARLGRAGEEPVFEPLPEQPAPPRRSMGKHLRQSFADMHPRHISSDYGMRPLIVLIVLRLFSDWDDRVFGLLIPEIREEFGVNVTFILTIATVVGFANKLLAPVVGWLVDRVRRVPVLAIGHIASNLGSVASGLAPSPAGLAGARLGQGVLGSVQEPAAFPLLADWYRPEARGRLFALLGMASTLAVPVGALAAGGFAALLGWRTALVSLGLFAAVLSLLIFTLPEPIRGAQERRALGASDEAAAQEQPPMSWSETWRAASSIVTVRRIWYATPFLAVAGNAFAQLVPLYLAEEFGVGPLGRGIYVASGAVLGVVGLLFGGPIADRLLADRPARVMVLFGMVTMLGCVPIVLLAISPYLLASIIVGLPLGLVTALIGPAVVALMSLVLPPRMRGLGLQTFKPFEMLGLLIFPVIGLMADTWGLRGAMLNLVPLYLVGAAIVTSAAGGVARDIRAATAASMADEEARRSREEGRTKLLVCRDVDVTYDGAQVLFNVDFDVEDGEVVALLGTNGAGKSTLMRAIAGVHEASNGAIFLDGRDITHRPPAENAVDGVVFVPGGRAVFPSLTVADNLRTAGFLFRDEPEAVQGRIDEVLELFPSLRPRLDEVAGNLSGGEQQMLALGQAFIMRPRLLMIDELSLGLAPAVVERLLEVVRRINADGTTVILVEQSINVALTVARRAVFLEKGKVRFDGPTAELLHRSDLVRAVFLSGAGGGARPVARRRPAPDEVGERVLQVRDVVVSYGGVRALDGAGLSLDAGEVLGIIGPNGAGKTTLFDVISGFVRPDAGEVEIAGVDVAGLGPDGRARLGLARSFQNARLFPSLTVRDTIAVALETHIEAKSAVASALWLPAVARSERRVERRVAWLIELFGLEAFADKFVTELSTGSRRIVDLACIMATEPKVLLLDEPSSGLAQAETESLAPVVRRLARDASCGVVVIEHDIPLVTKLSDRLLAMELGRPIHEGEPHEVIAHPRVVEAYLGTDPSVVERSGPLQAALESAGLATGPTRRSTSE